MHRRALLSSIGALALAGCSGSPDGTTTTDTPTDTTAEEPTVTTRRDESVLELLEHELVRSNEGSASELATVTGTVRNPSDESVAEPTVTAAFRNADGETLTRASASAPDLSAGTTWSFEVVYPGTGEDARTVAGYRLTVRAGD